VHEIEAVRGIGPFELRVVELEFQVWRDEEGLDGGEVGADDCGGGIGIGEVAGGDEISMSKSRQSPRGEMRGVHSAYIAQIPVPVPTSSTLCGLAEMGARKSLLSSRRVNMWWL
jgi:hypothetical protein